MAKEIDRRNFLSDKVSDSRKKELKSIASAVSRDVLPGEHKVKIEKFDNTTGNAALVISESSPQPSSRDNQDYIERALEHLQNISGVLGLEDTQPKEFRPDPNVQKTTSNAAATHFQQQYKGIDIFQAATTVRFAPDGKIQEAAGNNITISDDIPVTTQLDVETAALIAARYVTADAHSISRNEEGREEGGEEQDDVDPFGQSLNKAIVELANFKPKIIATFLNQPAFPTVLDGGPLKNIIKANLIWFPLDNNYLRLAWEIIITLPNDMAQYRVIIAADERKERNEDDNNGISIDDDPRILYCKDLTQRVRAVARVCDEKEPSRRKEIDFPLSTDAYSPHLVNDTAILMIRDWIDNDSTTGYAAAAHMGESGTPYRCTEFRDGNMPVFRPAENSDDEKVLTTFYLCCYMHDLCYGLGFREIEGNFQRDNFGQGGMQGDPVDIRVYPEAVYGTANMSTPSDGSAPVMNVGLVERTNRHTALDSTVVFHEYMHGVTNRLVGGALDVRALDSPQSAGMGEGWGDYIACTILDVDVVGAWVVDDAKGIRKYRYDNAFPDNFGSLGRGRYGTRYGKIPVHAIGEIWCTALLEMNKRIGENLKDERRGKRLGLQLVIDALKLSPTNPSFLNMRDSIMVALDFMKDGGKISSEDHLKAKKGIWQAFGKKFGMGIGAKSNGAQLTGIFPDFSIPT
jgi:extracellular elastinolytic metalloproteinase